MPFYDAILARLLIGANRPAEARSRLQTGLDLAHETGMSFYDSELTRLRSLTTADAEQRSTDLRSAVELARSQGARVFELRAAMDYFGLDAASGRQLVADALARFPDDSAWPEVTRGRTLLG